MDIDIRDIRNILWSKWATQGNPMISSSDILKASILIVDDQEVNASLLEQMLRNAGYVAVSSTKIRTRSANCIAKTAIP